jgi:hypothetical protein
MQDILGVDGRRRTLAKREEVDGIEQVRLPHPVLPDEAVDVGREGEFHLFQIFIVQYRNTVQNHKNEANFIGFYQS